MSGPSGRVPRPPTLSRRAFVLGAAGGLAVAGCSGEDPAGPAELRIATGPPGAVFREVGTALAEVIGERLPRSRVRAIPTGASVENLRLLAGRRTELAFASLDAIVAGLAVGVPRSTTAVARLYDSFVHLVARGGDGPVRRLGDLTGRTVSMGAPGSGTQFTAGRLLARHPNVRPRLVNLDQAASAAALTEHRIDAFFTLTGVPTPAITRALPGLALRLVPLGDEVNRMNDAYGEQYAPATIPSSAYPGIPATDTMTVANLLLAQPGLEADVVEVITRALFDERARIARSHPEANRINIRTGIATSPVPLHPGASRYYRSVKR
jgi:TRAP transporter TAXI family solute receptor